MKFLPFARFLRISLLSLIVLATTLPQAVYAQQKVVGLVGAFIKAENQPFANFFITNDAQVYGVVGQTVELEAQLDQLRQRSAAVRLWGDLYPNGLNNASSPVIVVTAILELSAPTPTTALPTPIVIVSTPAPRPTVAPSVSNNPPTATSIVDTLNLRSGPDTNYEPPVGRLTRNQTCVVTGRNAANTWFQVRCSDTLAGWVLATLVTTNGNMAAVPVINLALPTPSDRSAKWQAFYYNNQSLSDPVIFSKLYDAINFNWGSGSPHPSVATDNFSVRFERTFNFAPDSYRFVVQADDGVRVSIDDNVIINEWHFFDSAVGDTFSAVRSLSGSHRIRVEYYEGFGNARLYFAFTSTAASAGGIPPTVTKDQWLVEYFANPELKGPSAIVRQEPRAVGTPLSVEFGNNSPVASVVPSVNWSARWRGRFYFDGGNYTFWANGALGMRVYIDNILVINAWQLSGSTVSNTFREIGAGDHEIMVEYYKFSDWGWVRAWWQRNTSGPQ